MARPHPLLIEPKPLSAVLEALVDKLARLTPQERREVVRAVEERVSVRQPVNRPVAADYLLTASGIVSLGGDAVEDSRALYDG